MVYTQYEIMRWQLNHVYRDEINYKLPILYYKMYI